MFEFCAAFGKFGTSFNEVSGFFAVATKFGGCGVGRSGSSKGGMKGRGIHESFCFFMVESCIDLG